MRAGQSVGLWACKKQCYYWHSKEGNVTRGVTNLSLVHAGGGKGAWPRSSWLVLAICSSILDQITQPHEIWGHDITGPTKDHRPPHPTPCFHYSLNFNCLFNMMYTSLGLFGSIFFHCQGENNTSHWYWNWKIQHIGETVCHYLRRKPRNTRGFSPLKQSS